MHRCGVMIRSMYTHTLKKYINTIHHHSMGMYGLKWNVLTSWSRFSTREYTDTHTHRETPISMICDRGVILLKTISYNFTSLVACQVTRDDSSAALLHYALYINNGHVTWWLIAEETIFGNAWEIIENVLVSPDLGFRIRIRFLRTNSKDRHENPLLIRMT